MTPQRQIKNARLDPPAISSHGLLERKTDLAAIKGQQVLLLVDEQNLSISAQDLGYILQYNLLAKRIRAAAESAALHIFIAAGTYHESTKQRFENLGYAVHTKAIRHTRLPNGEQRYDCNIDNLFAFWAGLLAAKNSCGVIVLASGDYGLSGELAEAICNEQTSEQMQIMTLSLPGSTAQKLDARSNQHITANLEIGLDLLKPLCTSDRRLSARALGSCRPFRF